MRQPKYRCPKCGNTELVFAKDTIVQRTYKLRLDGEPYARQFDTTEFYSDGDSERIECTNCNHSVTLEDGVSLKKWHNPEYKPAKKKR
jgi:DNA-directed RNA polymerase subunit RPC12/RpoP